LGPSETDRLVLVVSRISKTASFKVSIELKRTTLDEKQAVFRCDLSFFASLIFILARFSLLLVPFSFGSISETKIL
jgi:hypothetical protein